MKACSHCGCQVADEVKFCPACGGAFLPPQDMPPSPPPYYGAPPMGCYPPPPPPKPKPPALAKSIVGMILSINGLVGASIGILALLYVAAMLVWAWTMMMSDGYYDPDLLSTQGFFRAYILLMAVLMAAETLPCAIIGRFLGTKAQDEGNETKIAQHAVKLGKIGMILSLVMLGIGALCTAVLYRL